jgi:hypothetical protein
MFLHFFLFICLFFNRGKQLFEFSDHELAQKGGYDLIHPDDLNYYASGHQERKSSNGISDKP